MCFYSREQRAKQILRDKFQEDSNNMEKLKIAVYEKTYEDASLLKQYLEELLQDVKVRIFKKEGELLEILDKPGYNYSAIFLGITLTDMNGIEVAKLIRKHDLFVPIIYISDTDAYYKEAYATFAYNYLLKPITKGDLARIMYPLKCRWDKRKEKVLHFRYFSQINILKLCQIIYISSHLHTVTFHLADGETRSCRGKLDDFTGQLEGSSIVRCHQSFFVNMDYATALRKDCFMLGDLIIPVSRAFSKVVRERYMKHLGGEAL